MIEAAVDFVMPYFWMTAGGTMASWLLYVLVFGIKPIKDQIRERSRLAYYTLYTLALGGYLWDIFLNLTVATVAFADLPRELTITYRLRRYLRTDTGWRFHVADWMCRHMLEIIDTGHCDRD